MGDIGSLGSDLSEPLGNQKAGRYIFIALEECRSEKVAAPARLLERDPRRAGPCRVGRTSTRR